MKKESWEKFKRAAEDTLLLISRAKVHLKSNGCYKAVENKSTTMLEKDQLDYLSKSGFIEFADRKVKITPKGETEIVKIESNA